MDDATKIITCLSSGASLLMKTSGQTFDDA